MSVAPVQSVEQTIANIRSWAAGVPIISQVYIFGSRVKGNSTCLSDIDIAVRIDFDNPGTALAHWMSHCDSWKAHIEKIVPFPIDLQWFHPTATPIVADGLRSAAIVAFRRDEETFY
jgi:predicted nucleotidyltransferase